MSINQVVPFAFLQFLGLVSEPGTWCCLLISQGEMITNKTFKNFIVPDMYNMLLVVIQYYLQYGWPMV